MGRSLELMGGNDDCDNFFLFSGRRYAGFTKSPFLALSRHFIILTKNILGAKNLFPLNLVTPL